MDKYTSRQLIKETFQNSFKKERFVHFLRELLNHFEDTLFVYRGNFIPHAYNSFIKTLERVGKYEDEDGNGNGNGNGNKIDLLIVQLKKDSSLEHARTMQRNFIAWYLNGSRGGTLKDAALVAFVSPGQEDWRFSLVKMDYQFDTSGKKIKVNQEFTPARRFSFLVGKNESSHTAQSRLMPMLEDDIHSPTLNQIEEVFSIEKVTKEFFEGYRELFLKFKESLEELVKKDPKVGQEFEDKDIDIVDFVKKTLGQIVFLYFLQKKGWFGVKRRAEWGSGSKHFLRKLFEKKHSDYRNFFNDILEPLFYEALRQDRSYDDDYYSKLDCRIPFLNGGLFDPINNYDWVNADVLLSNELFSNSEKTKKGDIGTGIFDMFDRFNFTVKEDEPLEKEVAVDPEMLGKVFENLLVVKDRKLKGTYYTPREIVHYMCQQSLINYLATELKGKVKKEEIETLVKYGETAIEHDIVHIQKIIKNSKYKGRYAKSKLPKSIEKHAELIDEKLVSVRICDPAVGSGAFPVGMMSEIIRTRNALSPYLESEKNRTIYNFKRHAIQNCLYGVDIDPGAVEIAKLRLWLSLIVDEEDIKQIKPLPNLDYKIVCGNSLLGVEKNLFNANLFSKLEELKLLFFNETNTKKKQEYKNQIDELINQITNGRKDFNFEVYFSEVFHEQRGFDVVIANPPYVRQEEITKYKSKLEDNYEIYNSVSDLYTYFYEKSIKLLRKNGVLSFISSNKFMRARYGKNLRNYLRDKTEIDQIVNFETQHIFESIANTLILITKNKNPNRNEFLYGQDINRNNFIRFPQENLEEDAWTIALPEIIDLKEKIEKQGIVLRDWNIKIFRGLLTGYNKAFIIDTSTRDKLCKEDPRNSELIKPIIRGRDIDRYYHKCNGEWVIFIPWHFPIHFDPSIAGASKVAEDEFMNKYPSLYNYLLEFKKELSARNKNETGIRYEWYALQRHASNYIGEFSKEKVIWIELTDKNKFSFSNKEEYILAGAFLMTGEPLKYLLSFLNSNVCQFYFNLICNSSGMATVQWKKFAIERIPIMKISDKKQEPFVKLVDKIFAITKDKDYIQNENKQKKVKEHEHRIDKMVYELYDLTPKEIKIIEDSIKN